jgi:hypothetical protein
MPRKIPALAWLALGLIVALPAFVVFLIEGRGVLASLVAVIWGLVSLATLVVPVVQLETVQRIRRTAAARGDDPALPLRRRSVRDWVVMAAVGGVSIALGLSMFCIFPDVIAAAEAKLPF